MSTYQNEETWTERRQKNIIPRDLNENQPATPATTTSRDEYDQIRFAPNNCSHRSEEYQPNTRLKRTGLSTEGSYRMSGFRLVKICDGWFSEVSASHCPSLFFRPTARVGQITLVLRSNNGTTALKRTINYRVNSLETRAGFKRAWLSALSDERIDDPIHTAPLRVKRASYASDTDVLMTNSRAKSGSRSWRKLIKFMRNALRRYPYQKSKKPLSTCSHSAQYIERNQNGFRSTSRHDSDRFSELLGCLRRHVAIFRAIFAIGYVQERWR